MDGDKKIQFMVTEGRGSGALFLADDQGWSVSVRYGTEAFSGSGISPSAALHNAALCHFQRKHAPIPAWVAVEILRTKEAENVATKAALAAFASKARLFATVDASAATVDEIDTSQILNLMLQK